MLRTRRNLYRVIGRRAARDIYSEHGVLLLAAFTIITKDQIYNLEKHGISLSDQDVIMATEESIFENNQMMIDESVQQVNQLFEEIRITKKIPIADLRTEVIPVIQEVANSTSLFGLFTALQAKDDYTYRHNLAVGALASLIGSWLDLSRQEHLQLTTAAFLHDVGKMLIPSEILNKPDKLTDEEYAVMKTHTISGYNLLKETVGITHRQALVALQHHERMDGSGYPFGLFKEQIDLFSRIVSVADIFHAMTSKRVYRHPSPFYEVLFEMERDAFGVLDPAITKLFVGKIMETLIGRSVQLSDGSEGTILLIQPHDPTHPLLQVGHGFIDLSKDRTIQIMNIL